MSIQEHEPLSAEPAVPTEERRKHYASAWTKRGIKQPWIAVFHYAMNSTPRPSAPNETIAFGYMNLNKFHDREPEAVMKVIEEIDPNWFDNIPRKPTTTLDAAFKRAALGELARIFYRYGLSAYGKPNLRKQADPAPGTPLAAI
jgi:hypothetical protein